MKGVVIQHVLKKFTLDQKELVNYRLVSNLPFLDKIFECVVSELIQRLLDD